MLLTLEPALRLVYVEGRFDRDLYRWDFRNRNMRDVAVYEIATVEIPKERLIELGLTSGERQRVQAAAAAFEQDVHFHSRLIFLADADMDYLLDRPQPNRPLHRTLATATEMILWRTDVLARFVEVGLGREFGQVLTAKMMEAVEPALVQVCVLRAVKESLHLNWKAVPIEDCFDRKTNTFSFDTYCNKVASRNSCHKELEMIIPTSFDAILTAAEALPSRQKIHSHDFLGAVARFLRACDIKNKSLDQSEELTRLLLVSLEWETVKDDPMLLAISDVLKQAA